MKNVLLVIIVLFSFKGYSQESEIKELKMPEATMIKLVVDEFTDKQKFYPVQEAKFAMYKDGGNMSSEGLIIMPVFRMEKRGNLNITLSVRVYGMSSCIKKGSTLDVIFENGEKTRLINWNDFNCKKLNLMNFSKEQFQLFKNNKIKAVKYTNTEDFKSMVIKDNIDDDINSILMTVFNEVDKVNKREMSVRLRE